MRIRYPARLNPLMAGAGLAAVALFAVPLAQADVKLTENVAVEGSGVMSLANMAGSTVTSISGKNARMDNDMRMESKLVRMFARDAGNTSEVVRLGDDVVLEIETRKKRFRQSSVSARRAQLELAAQQLRQAQAQQPMSSGLDDTQCEWSDPKSQVHKGSDKRSFAGVSAQQTTVVVKQPCKLRTTGAVCEVGISSDLWLAPDFPGAMEAQQFRKAYAEQLGLTTGGGTLGQQAQSLLGRYPAAWSRLAEEMRKIKGHALKTTFTLEMDGAGCAAPSAQAGEGAANPAAVASQIMGGLFGRKKQEPADDTTTAATAPKGSSATAVVVLRLTTELMAIESAPLNAETFQAPAGFKKIDP